MSELNRDWCTKEKTVK